LTVPTLRRDRIHRRSALPNSTKRHGMLQRAGVFQHNCQSHSNLSLDPNEATGMGDP
jgi:hypothetical protein